MSQYDLRDMQMNGSKPASFTEFELVGFPGLLDYKIFLFVGFLLLLLITLTANFLILLLVSLDHRLHTPMYFFLCNLSLLDILMATSIIPKLLAVLSEFNKTISLSACIGQMYFIVSVGTAENCLVAAMAYDRYIAVVKPLHYNVIINFKKSFGVAVIGNYVPLLFVLWTYVRIVISVLKLKTTESRAKAFSMCFSHVTVVVMYYVSASIVHAGLRINGLSYDGRIFIGGLNYFLMPMVNPMIYSLRNEKMKEAAKRYMHLHFLFPQNAKNSADGTDKVLSKNGNMFSS
ncbi:olfactory receptor 6S1-like [Erpetoichthys calabaricus]|uniref:olfactory receptor 6S1-like n=1 Tax=Erpetoichthys calabaricus TaxID=27687 RepID=UPI002233E4C1|nr:olfactory receptor 6S1-like [Erpetoichthys calabaricus]